MKIAKVNIPNDIDCRKPLAHAAYYGHLEMCRFIMLSKKIRDKNPKCKSGTSPLYWAASNCHLKVCILIIQNVKDHNPKNIIGHTPLHSSPCCTIWSPGNIVIKMKGCAREDY